MALPQGSHDVPSLWHSCGCDSHFRRTAVAQILLQVQGSAPKQMSPTATKLLRLCLNRDLAVRAPQKQEGVTIWALL